MLLLHLFSVRRYIAYVQPSTGVCVGSLKWQCSVSVVCLPDHRSIRLTRLAHAFVCVVRCVYSVKNTRQSREIDTVIRVLIFTLYRGTDYNMRNDGYQYLHNIIFSSARVYGRLYTIITVELQRINNYRIIRISYKIVYMYTGNC